jgi:hypothetical protein
MLSTILFFSHAPNSTFHFPLGMFSSTLFDLAAISSLRLDGVNPNFYFDKEIDGPRCPNLTFVAFRNFLVNNMKHGPEPIFDSKHVAFILYWLSKYAFCSKLVAIPSDLVPIAISLHMKNHFV